MKTLITGGTGFLGAAVLRQLLRTGHDVRALRRAGSDRRNLKGLGVEEVVGDLADPGSLKAALKECRALFHVAADYRLWVPDPERMYAANVDGTVALMRAALQTGVQRIVYTSSVATLGLHRNGTPADEKTPAGLADMIGPYKRSKYLAEAAVHKLVDEEGLPAVIVNPSTPIGPRDIKPTPTGQMVIDAAAGRMPAFVDTGLNIVHVDDVAAGHLRAFERGRIGRRYILGGQNLSLREIFSQIAAITGQRPPRVRLHPNLILPVAWLMEAWIKLKGSGEPRVTVDGVRLAKKKMFFSSRRARQELGYVSGPIQPALHAAVAWFRKSGYLT